MATHPSPGLTAPALLEIESGADLGAAATRAVVLDGVESGRIVLLRDISFELTPRERDLIQDTAVILPGQKERESRIGRPTLILDPASGTIERTKIQGEARREVEAMMRRFSAWAENMVATLLPTYSASLQRDRVTYRPCERSIPQGMHVDSSYGRPTRGRGMLRLFTNINVTGRPRVWQVGEPFEPFVQRFLPRTRRRSTFGTWLLHRIGITRGRQTAFDRLMADIRRLAKSDAVYQQTGPREIIEFPSGASWLVITDLAVHGAISGQHSLDQTYFLPVTTMRDPARSSLRILERLTGRALV
jgi:hypothetical protein